MLRDLTEAVTEVAERIFDLPAIPGTAGDATTGRKQTMGISKDPCPKCADKGINVKHGSKIGHDGKGK